MRKGGDEIWRRVPCLPWYYEVSNKGRLRSLARRDRRGWAIKDRIHVIPAAEFYATMPDGSKKWCSLAGCVLRAFRGPPKRGQRLARHLDDDRSNNAIENLAWGTDQDNANDQKRNGKTTKGQPRTKAHIAALRAGFYRYHEGLRK